MMSRKDGFLALLVVVVWGLNFVVIKVGLHHMPPLLLAGLRFLLVAFPAIFFVARPKVPLTLLLGYGLTISFGQFAFLFCAIKFGMPAGLASLVLQAQAFFTMALGAFVFSERLQRKQLAGIALAIIGVLVLIEASLNGQHIAMSGFMLTLAAAFSWACGNIFNKKIMQHSPRPAVMSLVVWSALIPILPFLLSSLLLEGADHITQSLITIDMTTILSLLYLAFVATILGYGIWGTLLGRYETWRVAPLSLLVPVVGLASAAVLLGETLTGMQLAGAVLIMAGLYINVFGFRVRRTARVRGQRQYFHLHTEPYHHNCDAPENAQYGQMRFAIRRRQQQKQTDNQQGNSDTDERRGMAITQFTKHKAADDPGAAEDQ